MGGLRGILAPGRNTGSWCRAESSRNDQVTDAASCWLSLTGLRMFDGAAALQDEHSDTGIFDR